MSHARCSFSVPIGKSLSAASNFEADVSECPFTLHFTGHNKFRYWVPGTKKNLQFHTLRNLRHDTRGLESWLAVWGTLALPHVRTVRFEADQRQWFELQLTATEITVKVESERRVRAYGSGKDLNRLHDLYYFPRHTSDDDVKAFVLRIIDEGPQGEARLTPLRLLAIVQGLYLSSWLWVSAKFATKSVEQQDLDLMELLNNAAFVERMK